MSRLTTHADRHRQDLVLPLAEVRVGHGQLTGARGLGVYGPRWQASTATGDWRVKLSERQQSRPLPRDWVTSVLFAASTALGGVIALAPGVLGNAAKNRRAGGGQFWATWLTLAFLAASAAALTVAARWWLIRQRMPAERREIAPCWASSSGSGPRHRRIA